jgi:hypothetical protein
VVLMAYQRLDEETRQWYQLEHKNIQPFLGVSNEIGNHKAIISPWQANGKNIPLHCILQVHLV